MITLPAIDPQKKWRAVGLGYAAFGALYTLTGRVHLRPVATLPFSLLDRLLPFTDWMVWVYLSQFAFLFSCLRLLKQRTNLSRVLYGMALASLLSFSVFFVCPVALPRDHQASTGVTGLAFKLLYLTDSSANCLPSLHVSLAWLAALGMVEERGRCGWGLIVWASTITLSTLLTRQHYAADVVAGMAVTVFCRGLISRVHFA